MHASLPVAAELGLLYFITKACECGNVSYSIPSLRIKGFGKESLSSCEVKAYPGKFPPSRENNVGLFELLPLGVKYPAFELPAD